MRADRFNRYSALGASLGLRVAQEKSGLFATPAACPLPRQASAAKPTTTPIEINQ